jgi:small subunit ribosomal protein S8
VAVRVLFTENFMYAESVFGISVSTELFREQGKPAGNQRQENIMHSDPIADMLTRIRNGVSIERPFVEMPYSKLKHHVAEVLQREGFIWDAEVIDGEPFRTLRVNLKYGPNGEIVINHIQRVSRPGRRVYAAASEMNKVRHGTGITVVTTPQGVLSNREARTGHVGGEVLAEVW